MRQIVGWGKKQKKVLCSMFPSGKWKGASPFCFFFSVWESKSWRRFWRKKSREGRKCKNITLSISFPLSFSTFWGNGNGLAINRTGEGERVWNQSVEGASSLPSFPKSPKGGNMALGEGRGKEREKTLNNLWKEGLVFAEKKQMKEKGREYIRASRKYCDKNTTNE